MSEFKGSNLQDLNSQPLQFKKVSDIFSQIQDKINPFTATMLKLGDDVNEGRTITNNEWTEICKIKEKLDYKTVSTTDRDLTDICDLIKIDNKNDESRQKTTLEQTIADSCTKNCLIGTGCCIAGSALLVPLCVVNPAVASTTIKAATMASTCASTYPLYQGVECLSRAYYLNPIKNIETDISDLRKKWDTIHTKEDVQRFKDKCYNMITSIKKTAQHISLSPTNAVKLLNCYYQLEQLHYHPIIPNTPSNNKYNEAQIKDDINNNQIDNKIINKSPQKDT